MTKDKCYYLGKIVKPHGYKGGVSVLLDVDDPSPYANLDAVFVEINNKLSPMLIKEVRLGIKTQAIFKFEEINSEDDAKFLANRALYLPLEALPELKENQFYYHEIIRYKVFDVQHGELGYVKNVLDLAVNPLIEAVVNDKEYLIPINDMVILKVDKKEQLITIKMPDGLLELYLG